MRVLLVDNYDSFTFNLAQLVASIQAVAPRVVKNDELTVEEILAWRPERVILSPGPGRPDVSSDVGVCGPLIERLGEVPLLGVCLGHQAIAIAFGARVVLAPEPIHGRIATIRHAGDPLFAQVPPRFRAVRYHSLVVDEDSLPPSLRATAWSDDGLVMAIAHRDRPIAGVQFHPESVLSEFGREIVENFLGKGVAAVAPKSRKTNESTSTTEVVETIQSIETTETTTTVVTTSRCNSTNPANPAAARLRVRELPWVDPERVFLTLFADERLAFWLDSADGRGRFSYMGAGGEEVRCEGGRTFVGGRAVAGDPFAIFEALVRERVGEALPFEFSSGLVGFLGYGMKRFSGGEIGPRRADQPADAHLMRAERVIAFDHAAHLVTLVATDGDERWLDDTARRIAAAPEVSKIEPRPGAPIAFRRARGEARYRADIAEVKRLLRAGETYEICLTTQVRCEVTVEPLALYRILRARNPAPFAALLRFGDLSVLSSSPERFVHVDRAGLVESRPIKGTRRRGHDEDDDARLAAELATSEKDRAENLMIVDLVRNDLGRVCRIGSVCVPSLMEVERHPTVLQLVSTVRGQLADGARPLDAVRALFPGGSMTGAPKIRSMKILDALEGEPRGIYAGGIGFFSSSGAVDLAMAIRTLVVRPGELSFGVGGAIVAQSDPDDEVAEVLLKGRALMESIAEAAGAPSWEIF